VPRVSRDPLSEWFDPAARRLLTRAYNNRGQWTGVFLSPPTLEQRARAAQLGIWDLYERDRWGEQRWVRAFKRAVYYQLHHHGFSDRPRWDEERTSPWPGVALQWETGQRVIRRGWPTRRWAIRVTVHDKSGAKYRAESRRVYAQYGPGSGKQSTADDHDWDQ